VVFAPRVNAQASSRALQVPLRGTCKPCLVGFVRMTRLDWVAKGGESTVWAMPCLDGRGSVLLDERVDLASIHPPTDVIRVAWHPPTRETHRMCNYSTIACEPATPRCLAGRPA
jgi:hypothetical protein